MASVSGRRSRIPGFPESFPLAFAALMPAFVRSEINERSSCATAPSTWRENMPCGVVVSIGSRSERKCTPLSVRPSITSSKWLTERASRSIRTTRRVSPAESRPGARCAGAVLLDDHIAADRAQFDFLRFCRLFIRRHARIADQAALWSTGSSFLRLSCHLERLRAAHRSVFQT